VNNGVQMNLEEYTKDKLCLILVETVHANVMYPTHKAYTRDVILREKADISAQELASKLNLPLGEALVILQELTSENRSNL
jgi:hypothetical protein